MCKECGGSSICQSMDADAVVARSVEEAAFVSMDEGEVSARSAEEAAFVSINANAVSVESVEEVAFVSMDEYVLGARSVEGAAFVSMDEESKPKTHSTHSVQGVQKRYRNLLAWRDMPRRVSSLR